MRVEGRAKAEKKANETVVCLLENDIPLSVIAQACHLTEDDVARIASEHGIALPRAQDSLAHEGTGPGRTDTGSPA